MEHFIAFVGHVVFLLLTRPSAHNDNFPYHVRTSQIGIMAAMEDNSGSNSSANSNSSNNGMTGNTLDAFSHGGAYAVSSPATAMDVFTVDAVGGGGSARLLPPPYAADMGPWAENALTAETDRRVSNGDLYKKAENGKIYDPNEDEDDITDWHERNS